MDAIFMSSPAEKSFSPYKQLKNIPRRNSLVANYLVSKPSENLAPTNNIIHGGGGGLFFVSQPPLSFSYLPSASLLNPFYQNHHHQLQQQQQMKQQPPLLPLPVIPNNKSLHNSLPCRSRRLSSSPSNSKNNKTRDQSLIPKISKSKQLMAGNVEDQPKKNSKQTEATKTQAMISKSLVMVPTSASPIGPDPNDLPKVLASSYLATGSFAKDLEKFSGSVFTLSPPPSSLPLPKFLLRPKLSCNAEAAGVDPGATDNLRRLLRLR